MGVYNTEIVSTRKEQSKRQEGHKYILLQHYEDYRTLRMAGDLTELCSYDSKSGYTLVVPSKVPNPCLNTFSFIQTRVVGRP